MCVREGGGWVGGHYQSCCQSAGQVVIREAVWQPVGIYLCLRLSTSHTHTHSLKRWRKTLLCSPLPPLSEHGAGVPGRGAGLSRQPFVRRIPRMTERNTDGETRGGAGGSSDSAAAGQSVGFRLPRYLNRPRHLTALHPGTFFFKPQLVLRQARCLI